MGCGWVQWWGSRLLGRWGRHWGRPLSWLAACLLGCCQSCKLTVLTVLPVLPVLLPPFLYCSRYAEDPQIKLAISFALAQSTKLSVLEERTRVLGRQLSRLPVAMAETGDLPPEISEKRIMRVSGRVWPGGWRGGSARSLQPAAASGVGGAAAAAAASAAASAVAAAAPAAAASRHLAPVPARHALPFILQHVGELFMSMSAVNLLGRVLDTPDSITSAPDNIGSLYK